mgnify:FL=1
MTKSKRRMNKLLLTTLCVLSIPSGFSEESTKNYSPYTNIDYPENLYWGDTHVHSSLSPDAYSWGNRLDPDVAYRFAKGETITSNSGQPLRIATPLDFLVVTDHAEFVGVFPKLDKADTELLKTELGRRWYQMYQENKRQEVMMEFVDAIRGSIDLKPDRQFHQSIWQGITHMAEAQNEPGKFTAFIGYEWTSLIGGNNLHRNIIFRDGADSANQVVPFSSLDSSNPEDLWQWMQNYETKTGGQALAIPHNGNASNGTMFADKTLSGEALTRRYAETRSRWEPLYEVTQVKGDAEAHPTLSPDDGFADFETWDFGNFGAPGNTKEEWMLQHEYARSALKLGLKHEAELGANPFKFGMIGSTDSHTSFANASEDNFFGKFGTEEPRTDRVDHKNVHGILMPPAVALNSSGYAAVWAHENTRVSIFDAMRRKETYATTGPRIVLRFFGGWAFDPNDVLRPDYVAIGYTQGVPMGADLINAPRGESPDFLIVASKDPKGANLDRIQVVKGWLDQNGELQEKVYDVTLSDGRKVQRNGKVKPLKHTVDIETASYKNTIGDTELATVWSDPDFNPAERAFYYVRVLEIPTPRWSTYDSVYFKKALPQAVPAIIQERAYSSPIWYTP